MAKSKKELKDAFAALRSFDELFPQEPPEDYSKAIQYLENLYEGLKFEYVGGVIPIQADAMFKGERIYFRYRGDAAKLMIGEDIGADKTPNNPKIVYIENVTGEKSNGWLNSYEFEKTFNTLFQMLINGEAE